MFDLRSIPARCPPSPHRDLIGMAMESGGFKQHCSEADDLLEMGVLKTIDYIVSNPRRSPGRKIVDVVALCCLWLLTAVSAYMNFVKYPLSGWEPAMFVLIVISVIASARSWYQYPRGRRSTLPPD